MDQEAVININPEEVPQPTLIVEDEKIISKNPSPVQELVTPVVQTQQPNIASEQDDNEKNEINYQKGRIPRLKEEVEEWLNEVTKTVDINEIPILEDGNIETLKNLIELFKVDEQSNENALLENLDLLHFVLPLMENSREPMITLGNMIKNLINEKLEITLESDRCLRLVELLAKREDCKDSTETSIYSFFI